MTQKAITNDTPVAMLTLGQLKEALGTTTVAQIPQEQHTEKRYAYGLRGLADIFGCSLPTASRIKSSGQIAGAIKQVGRKIIIDIDLALELAGKKTGGRR